MNEDYFKLKREQLVFHMQSIGALQSENLKQAFLNVKRELFVPEHLKQVSCPYGPRMVWHRLNLPVPPHRVQVTFSKSQLLGLLMLSSYPVNKVADKCHCSNQNKVCKVIPESFHDFLQNSRRCVNLAFILIIVDNENIVSTPVKTFV